tara:strand:+ start:170 stop:439 length:270 start_codon:yes stop_codon:yes gene_type:complete
MTFISNPFFNLMLKKTILLGDILILGGKSPFLVKRLIVETEIPIRSETSLMVKKGRFCEFMWWGYGGEIYQNRLFFTSYSLSNYQYQST